MMVLETLFIVMNYAVILMIITPVKDNYPFVTINSLTTEASILGTFDKATKY